MAFPRYEYPKRLPRPFPLDSVTGELVCVAPEMGVRVDGRWRMSRPYSEQDHIDPPELVLRSTSTAEDRYRDWFIAYDAQTGGAARHEYDESSAFNIPRLGVGPDSVKRLLRKSTQEIDWTPILARAAQPRGDKGPSYSKCGPERAVSLGSCPACGGKMIAGLDGFDRFMSACTSADCHTRVPSNRPKKVTRPAGTISYADLAVPVIGRVGEALLEAIREDIVLTIALGRRRVEVELPDEELTFTVTSQIGKQTHEKGPTREHRVLSEDVTLRAVQCYDEAKTVLPPLTLRAGSSIIVLSEPDELEAAPDPSRVAWRAGWEENGAWVEGRGIRKIHHREHLSDEGWARWIGGHWIVNRLTGDYIRVFTSQRSQWRLRRASWAEERGVIEWEERDYNGWSDIARAATCIWPRQDRIDLHAQRQMLYTALVYLLETRGKEAMAKKPKSKAKPPKMTGIYLSEELKKQAKMLALKHDMSFKAWLEKLITEALKKEGNV